MSTRGRKADLDVSEGGLDENPPAPAHLPDDMVHEWDSIIADLQERKLLTQSMLGVVDTYVMAQWNAREAQAQIEKYGVVVAGRGGELKQNPAITLLGKSQGVVARLCAELGLTPAARSRSKMKVDDDDERDDLFSGMDI